MHACLDMNMELWIISIAPVLLFKSSAAQIDSLLDSKLLK